jgi:dihydrofolate synthase / folylpolyglutamate synthase
VEAAVVEVGLGGRLDATNIVEPRVAVISSLSYDHMAVLGNTLTLIAGEKAGIIKAGIPVVSAPQKPEALLVVEQVTKDRGAALTLVGRDLLYEAEQQSIDGQTFTIFLPDPQGAKSKSVILRIPLLGQHQVVNAATAYAALKASGLEISEEAIEKGFARVNWPCRFEIVSRQPVLILDSAHNLDSFEKLDETLAATFPGRGVILIFGASEDKDITGMLAALRSRVTLLLATRANHPRALEPEKVIEQAAYLGLKAEGTASVQAALMRALDLASKNDLIIVSAGSMFVTAEVKTAWEKGVHAAI